MGKCCLHASTFIFDRIIIKLAGNQDRHKSSVEFDFGPNQTSHFGVTCPFHTFELEDPWSWSANLDQILCVASFGWGKGCLRFWDRLDHNSGFHGNRKPILTYNGENGVSTFSRLFLIRSFLYLQVTRTCIKSRTSSNFGQIGSLTTKLAALRSKTFPIDLQWENGVSMLAHSFFIESSSKLLVTRTGIKAQASSVSDLWFPWPIYMFFWNAIWPLHIGLRWAIVAL